MTDDKYIDRTQVTEIFAEMFCGGDECNGICVDCKKGDFITKILNTPSK